jgi:hypothetical protein
MSPPAWLDQWPAASRSTLAQLFYVVIRRGTRDVPDVVAQVAEELERRLRWATDSAKRELFCAVLQALRDDPEDAETYAGELMAFERLPSAEKARLKAARAKAFVIEAMRGKAPSARQVAFLRSLGYTGAPPRERAEASAMIDRLLQGKGAR